MNEVGDILHGYDFGKTGIEASRKLIYCKCPSCGYLRWLKLRKANSNGLSRCKSCCGIETNSAGSLPHGKMENSPRWKGGRSIKGNYILVRIYESDPYFCMATHDKRGGGEILEHRLIMARHLGRPLAKQEHVHHKNGDKHDNRIENLELISPNNHSIYNKLCAHCPTRNENRRLKKRIKELENNMRLLTSEQ